MIVNRISYNYCQSLKNAFISGGSLTPDFRNIRTRFTYLNNAFKWTHRLTATLKAVLLVQLRQEYKSHKY